MAIIDEKYADRLLTVLLKDESKECIEGRLDQDFLEDILHSMWNCLLMGPLRARDGKGSSRRPERLVAALLRQGVEPERISIDQPLFVVSLDNCIYQICKYETGRYRVFCAYRGKSNFIICDEDRCSITIDEKIFAGFILEFEALVPKIRSLSEAAYIRSQAEIRAREIKEITEQYAKS